MAYRDLDSLISAVPHILSSRMIGIKLDYGDGPLFIIAVYLPSRSGCTDPFKESVNQLGAAIELIPPGCKVIVLGDFNADLGALGGPMLCSTTNEQGSIFSSYVNAWDLVSSHLHLSPTNSTYTYESEAHFSFSTIDHIICPRYLLSNLCSSKVLDDHPLNTSDHLPVTAEFLCSLFTPTSSTTQATQQPVPNWNKCSKDKIRQLYTEQLQSSLAELFHQFPSQANVLLQPYLLDDILHSFGKCLRTTAMNIPQKQFRKHKVPKWNHRLKEAQRKSKLLIRNGYLLVALGL